MSDFPKPIDEGFYNKVNSQMSSTLHSLKVLKNHRDAEIRQVDLEKLNESRARLVETITSSYNLMVEIVRIVSLPIPTKTCSVPVEAAIKALGSFRQQLSTGMDGFRLPL